MTSVGWRRSCADPILDASRIPASPARDDIILIWAVYASFRRLPSEGGDAFNHFRPGGWWDFPICASCHIYCPTPAARSIGGESWSYVDHRMVCSFCGKRALLNWSGGHVDAMRASLRSRTMWLFNQSMETLDAQVVEHASSSSETLGAQKKALKRVFKDLGLTIGRGRGPRPGRARVISERW
eukprot:1356288-Pyramimonas_sp.AAC.1